MGHPGIRGYCIGPPMVPPSRRGDVHCPLRLQWLRARESTPSIPPPSGRGRGRPGATAPEARSLTTEATGSPRRCDSLTPSRIADTATAAAPGIAAGRPARAAATNSSYLGDVHRVERIAGVLDRRRLPVGGGDLRLHGQRVQRPVGPHPTASCHTPPRSHTAGCTSCEHVTWAVTPLAKVSMKAEVTSTSVPGR